MLVATLVTFLYPGMGNYPADARGDRDRRRPRLVVSGKRVAMTDMPQMIALYNGMGGGAAAAIAAVELFRMASAAPGAEATHGPVVTALARPAPSSARCPSAAR